MRPDASQYPAVETLEELAVWRQAFVPVNDNQNSRLSLELLSSSVCVVDAGWAVA
jgi:hypothetical protein